MNSILNRTLCKVLFLFFCSTMLESCIDLSTCDSNVSGKYSCGVDQSNSHTVELRHDGNYYHYYKKGEFEIKNFGKWNIKKHKRCIIELDNWKGVDQRGNYEELGTQLLFVDGNWLNFGPDGESEESFKKQE